MKLEKGKWYKWFQANHGTTHIGKFDTISHNDTVRMKPWIMHTTSYNENGAFERESMQDIVEITDLTEIQKLLPDGPKFIVGKWYKNLNYGKNWFAKAISDSRMSGDNFYHGDYITDSKVFGEQSVSISNLLWNEDTVECPLSEIQQYLPDGHVDKVESKSERYIATMKFFEQLREPERSEAIENYDEYYSKTVPLNLYRAVSAGFQWGKSKQGYEYWAKLYLSINNNTYFNEELLVFGKYKVDDIVVSLTDWGLRKKGGLFTVRKESTFNNLYYEQIYSNANEKNWRTASPEEVEAYNQGIINIADIKPKNYNEAVHCTTQEESDFVLSKFNPHYLGKGSYRSDISCFILNHPNSSEIGKRQSYEFTRSSNYTILTFKEWCDKYNHCYVKEEATSLEGRYIKCLKENDWNKGKAKVGQVFEIKKVDRQGDLFIGDHCLTKSRLEKGEFELLPIDYNPAIWRFGTMFKKGDYIVTLINDGGCGKVNYCSKQKCDEQYLSPEIDTRGYTDNDNDTFAFSDNSQTKWRFGTKEEGEEYERQGKPYNVGSLLSSKIPDKPSEVDISYSVDKIGNFYVDDICISNCTSITPKEVYPNTSIPKPTTIILKTKSKSIKL